MIKRFVIAVVGFALVALTLGAVKVAQIKGAGAPPQPVIGVSTIDARSETWNPTISGIGTIAPVQGTSLSTEVEGTVTKINFENGQMVHAGDVLVEMDTSVEQAQLKAAEANLKWAKLSADRANELVQKNTISQAEVDQANAQYAQALATVTGLNATIAKKTLRAPFDGRVGIRAVNLGQFVSRGSPIVPLQKIDQLFVNFTLPERDIQKLKVGETVNISVDAFPNRTFEGKVNAISPEVDAATRNISVQAILDNPDELLRSGMFARVALQLPEGEPAVVVPATSVAYAAYGNSVFVVEKMKNKEGKDYLGVRQQFVKLGDKRGDLIAILDGVKSGEKVVSAGVFKLRNGMPVQENNTVQPTSNVAPTPANT
ncbi:MAG TPA: efflux RND transporter periplasmic adaptor subunit [Opitutaceae bacterium]|nr:efflux RND transporter periplasmic adaptor subunit [Opitutaceae bacterium]